MKWLAALFLMIGISQFVLADPLTKESNMLYVGTYTGPKSQGIYIYDLSADGKMTPRGLAAQTVSPSFLVPTANAIYSVNELGKGATLSSFSRDKTTGQLTTPTTQPAEGGWPCHLALSPSGKWLAVANYASGSAAVFPVKPDGMIGPSACIVRQQGKGPDPKRQESAHAHCANFTTDGRYLLVADLGLDKVFIYAMDQATGTLSLHGHLDAPPGAGPRHLVFSQDNRFVYVICEMGNSIAAFTWDPATATGLPLQTISILPSDFTGQSTAAEIALHPSGKFLYASNRGHDSIAIFAVDQHSGQLRLIGHQGTHGQHPRHFAISRMGDLLIVANRDTDNLASFDIDPATGQLAYLSSVPAPAATCVQFAP
jgi:6-phosphogluconolactonase